MAGLGHLIIRAVWRIVTHKEFLLGVLVALLLSYSWMFKGISVPNERTRVYLAVSMVDYSEISIDRAVARFGVTTDIASYNGRFYSDKAPGSSLLGAIVYGVARVFTSADDWTIDELINLMRSWVMIPIGLLGFFLLRRLLHELGMSVGVRDITSLGWILGSAAFHYSSAYYGHQLVAVSLTLSLLLLLYAQKQGLSDTEALPYFIGAGAAAGLAGLTEYQSFLPCLVLFTYVAAIGFRHPIRLAAFALSAMPFAIMLFAYNWSAFGGPFELSYEHLIVKNIKSMHTNGIGGVTVPHKEAVFGALLSLHRGLFTTSPVFLLAPHGLYLMWRRGRGPLALLVGLTLLYYLLFIFSAEVWFAGWGFGLRLLIPVMAWTMIPIAFSLEHIGRSAIGSEMAKGLVVCGLLYNQLVRVVFPELPEDARNPIPDLIIPAIREGQISPNLAAMLSGYPGMWTAFFPMALTIVAVILILRARVAKDGAPPKTGRAVLVSVSVMLPLILAIYLVGPHWKEKKTRDFINWMNRLEQAEFTIDKP